MTRVTAIHYAHPNKAKCLDNPYTLRPPINLAIRAAIAASFVGLAFGIRSWLGPQLGDELPFMFFIAASLVAAWCGGATMGILALIVGLLLGDRFFLHGKTAHPLSEPIQAAHTARYVLTAAIGVALIEVLHRGKRRTEDLVSELRSEVTRRKHSEAELFQAKTLLSAHAQELEHRVADRTAHLQMTVDSLESVLYEMTHNLRAPLRAMEGYSSILIQEHADSMNDTAKDLCCKISEAGFRMDLLISGLLKYGRLGHIEVTLESVKLRKNLDLVLAECSDQIRTKQADITVELSPLQLLGENHLLRQVLHSLLDNALKFARPNVQPRIRIYSEICGNIIRLWIEDNGIGINPKYHLRIFRPFECLAAHDAPAGTGMGLAVVAKAMERMGGKAGVESSPGHGSRFWLEFQQPSESSTAAAEPAPSILQKG